MSNKVYDQLKFLTQILLPALGALYFGLGQIWGFPAIEQVVGTVAVVDTFLGGLLGLSSKAYNNIDKPFDGDILVAEDATEIKRVVFDTEIAQMTEQDRIVLKVKLSETD